MEQITEWARFELDAKDHLERAKGLLEESKKARENAESYILAAFFFFLTGLSFFIASAGAIWWGAK